MGALLIPAGFSIIVGSSYMLFRQRFKNFFKQLMKDRLKKDLATVDRQLACTQGYLGDLRRNNPNTTSAASPTGSSIKNQVLDIDGLEVEIEHILDTIHQVEVDIEDLESAYASPTNRSEVAPATADGSTYDVRGSQAVKSET